MSGFLTTSDQQQVRRWIRSVPERIVVYLAAVSAWLLGPVVAIEKISLWRTFTVEALILALIIIIEFAFAIWAEGHWVGPPWGRAANSWRRLKAVLVLAVFFGISAWCLKMSLIAEQPGPMWGAVAAASLLAFGTLRHALRPPPERESMPPEMLRDQFELMMAMNSRGKPPQSDAEMRGAMLAVLVDCPDNRAARLVAWQMALREGDLSDAAHHIERLRALDFPAPDLAEMDALWSLAADQPERAADALDRRVQLIHENPRTTLPGQRADFIAILHLAHALTRATHWGRAAECLDNIARDYETAPFVGQLDRLIVNHMRWQAACALEAEQIARDLELRCRRFANRTVKAATRRRLGMLNDSVGLETIQWWPRAARSAVEWWETMRTRR